MYNSGIVEVSEAQAKKIHQSLDAREEYQEWMENKFIHCDQEFFYYHRGRKVKIFQRNYNKLKCI